MTVDHENCRHYSFDDFSRLFSRGEGRVFFITVIGRSGAMFLQSLLDNHPEIVMYPGIVNFYRTAYPLIAKGRMGWREAIVETLKTWERAMIPYNIRKNLGREKNESLEIDAGAIVALMEAEIGDGVPERKKLFLAFHYAVGNYFKTDMTKTRVIVCHEHTIKLSDKMIGDIAGDFPSAKFLCITRDPRSNYLSIVKREREKYRQESDIYGEGGYRRGPVESKCLGWYERWVEMIDRYASRFIVVRLEDIQSQKDRYVRKLAEEMGISYHRGLGETTFGGRLWWGDNFSPQQAGFRTSAEKRKWRRSLSPLKQAILEILLEDEIKSLGYELYYSDQKLLRALGWGLFPFWNADDTSLFFQPAFYAAARREQVPLGNVVGENILYYVRSLWHLAKMAADGRGSRKNVVNAIIRVE